MSANISNLPLPLLIHQHKSRQLFFGGCLRHCFLSLCVCECAISLVTKFPSDRKDTVLFPTRSNTLPCSASSVIKFWQSFFFFFRLQQTTSFTHNITITIIIVKPNQTHMHKVTNIDPIQEITPVQLRRSQHIKHLQ